MEELDFLKLVRRLVIVALFSDDELMERLVLKGGNLLDLAYGVSTRSSTDVDLSIDGDFGSLDDLKDRVQRVLSITFGEHGYVGLALYMLFWFCAWRAGSSVIRQCRKRPDLTWASDLAAMIQCAMIGFWVGGSFLGLAYWDYPYILVIIMVLTKVVVERQIAGESVKARVRTVTVAPSAVPTQQYPG